MRLWVLLALLFWVLAIAYYFINTKGILFSVFDGLLLAFLCFKLLPEAFLQGSFWQAVAGLLLGAFIGSFAEQSSRWQTVICSSIFHSAIFSLAVLFFYCLMKTEMKTGINFSLFLLVLVGGLFLSISCGGILPEADNAREKAWAGILGAAGFMIGTWQIYTF